MAFLLLVEAKGQVEEILGTNILTVYAPGSGQSLACLRMRGWTASNIREDIGPLLFYRSDKAILLQ